MISRISGGHAINLASIIAGILKHKPMLIAFRRLTGHY